tara:strand:- start:36 stop:326 length:291 start_codon:yes stop_codon:yes gene_type:complete
MTESKEYRVLEVKEGLFNIEISEVKTRVFLGLFTRKSIGSIYEYTEYQEHEFKYGGTVKGRFVKFYKTLSEAKGQIEQLKAKDVSDKVYPLVRYTT